MKILKFFVVLLISFLAKSQQTQAQTKSGNDTNSVTVHKDPRVDILVRKQAQINEETTKEGRKTAKGYRLLVINTNKRDEAIAAKTKVYTYFPDLKAYLIYQSPYFKVKVGNFKDRKDADDFRKELSVLFPNGVFIINDIIEIKPDKNKEEDNRRP
jgi:hypothetical protein